MKYSTIIVIILFSIGIYVSAYDCNHIDTVPALDDSPKIEPYGYYIVSDISPYYKSLELNRDYTFRIYDGLSEDSISGGEWRVIKDTLFLYEDYREYKDSIPEMWKGHKLMEEVYTPRNKLLTQTPRHSDYPFGSNVSAFIMEDYGNRLIPILGEKEFGVYWPVEMPVASDNGLYYESMWLDKTWPWSRKRMNWRRGSYTVKDKIEVDGQVVMVVLERDSIVFNVVNPQRYFDNDMRDWITPCHIQQWTSWMPIVKIGREYPFHIMRPYYNRQKATYMPQLWTHNTIYVAEGEAYGYFYALPDIAAYDNNWPSVIQKLYQEDCDELMLQSDFFPITR